MHILSHLKRAELENHLATSNDVVVFVVSRDRILVFCCASANLHSALQSIQQPIFKKVPLHFRGVGGTQRQYGAFGSDDLGIGVE